MELATEAQWWRLERKYQIIGVLNNGDCHAENVPKLQQIRVQMLEFIQKHPAFSDRLPPPPRARESNT